MFESFDVAEISIPKQIRKTGQHAWSTINVQLHMPWYFVSYTDERRSDCQKACISLFQQIEQLVDLSQSQDVNINEVNLVSPAYLNGKNSWTMDVIKEIWTAIEPKSKTKQLAFIYILQSGNRYVDSSFDTNEADLINPVLSFKTALKH